MLTTEKRQHGFISLDMYHLVSGKAYEMNLRRMKWRWLYDDEIEDTVLQDVGKLRQVLWAEPHVEFRPDCGLGFCAE